MSLTRKMLKGMSLTEEQIDTIVEAHSETVEALKTERDAYMQKAQKADTLQAELDDANQKLAAVGNDSWKVKYDALNDDFNTFKADIAKKETASAKKAAYEKLLKDAGISEKRIGSVMRVSNLDDIELDEEGNIKNSADVTKNVQAEWAEFIVKSSEGGASTANPPGNQQNKTYTTEAIKKMSAEEINAQWENIKGSLKG